MLYTKAEFKKAVSIWPKKYEAVPNCTILFKTTVSSGKNTILNIAGQSSYEVFINGEFVFHGPSRASHGFYRVDKLPIESYLTKDENEISVLVSGYHCHSFYHVSELAFFICELSDNGKVFSPTGTDSWQAYLYSQKLQRVERYSFQRTYCEVYDFTSAGVLEPKGDALEIKTYENEKFIEREVSYPNFPYEGAKCFFEVGRVENLDTPRSFSPW